MSIDRVSRVQIPSEERATYPQEGVRPLYPFTEDEVPERGHSDAG